MSSSGLTCRSVRSVIRREGLTWIRRLSKRFRSWAPRRSSSFMIWSLKLRSSLQLGKDLVAKKTLITSPNFVWLVNQPLAPGTGVKLRKKSELFGNSLMDRTRTTPTTPTTPTTLTTPNSGYKYRGEMKQSSSVKSSMKFEDYAKNMSDWLKFFIPEIEPAFPKTPMSMPSGKKLPCFSHLSSESTSIGPEPRSHHLQPDSTIETE